jgi:hypothetical protein
MNVPATIIAAAEAVKIVPKIVPVSITIQKQNDTDAAPWVGHTFNIRVDEAIGFLSMMRPGGSWQLVAIDPLARDLFGFIGSDGKRIPVNTRGETFTRHNARLCAMRIIEWQRQGLNVYCHVNPFDPTRKKPNARTGKISGKHRADRQSIIAIEYAHADVDPNPNETPEQVAFRVRHHLERLEVAPEFIVQSGRGCHVWLRYSTPLTGDGDDGPNTKRAEAINKRLCANMGVDVAAKEKANDPCWDICRILKIPGCISFPGGTKKGVPVLPASLLEIGGIYDA